MSAALSVNPFLRLWSGYLRLVARRPALGQILPFVPLVALWAGVVEAGLFPRAFFPGPVDVVRSFVDLTWKGILPAYLYFTQIIYTVSSNNFQFFSHFIS